MVDLKVIVLKELPRITRRLPFYCFREEVSMASVASRSAASTWFRPRINGDSRIPTRLHRGRASLDPSHAPAEEERKLRSPVLIESTGLRIERRVQFMRQTDDEPVEVRDADVRGGPGCLVEAPCSRFQRGCEPLC